MQKPRKCAGFKMAAHRRMFSLLSLHHLGRNMPFLIGRHDGFPSHTNTVHTHTIACTPGYCFFLPGGHFENSRIFIGRVSFVVWLEENLVIYRFVFCSHFDYFLSAIASVANVHVAFEGRRRRIIFVYTPMRSTLDWRTTWLPLWEGFTNCYR